LAVALTGSAFLFASFVQAADVENIKFERESKKIEIGGSCETGKTQVQFFVSSTEKIPVYNASAVCQNGRYLFKDDLRQWNMAAGEYWVGVAENGIVRIRGEDFFTVGEKTIDAGVSSTLHLETIDLSEDVVSATNSEDVAAGKSLSLPARGAWQEIFDKIKEMEAVAERVTFIFSQFIRATTAVFDNIFTQGLALLPGGNIILPEGKDQITGQGIIPNGATEVFVPNALVEMNSKILLTPLSVTIEMPLAVIDKVPGQGFTVGLAKSATQEVKFDWFLISTYQVGENLEAVDKKFVDEQPISVDAVVTVADVVATISTTSVDTLIASSSTTTDANEQSAR